MEEHTHPILCGGTFFTLLLQAIKQRKENLALDEGGSDNLLEQDVLIGLVKVFEPNYVPLKKSSMKTITSNFKNCKDTSKHLPFIDPAYIEAYDRCIKNDYQSSLMAMSIFVDGFINVVSSIEKHKWLVRSLLELVIQDQEIKNDQSFYICPNGQPILKSEFHNISNVCLPAFLLGIWHFIIVYKKDNTKGASTLKKWYEESEEKMKGKGLIGITGTSIKSLMKVYMLDEDAPILNGTEEPTLNNNDTQEPE